MKDESKTKKQLLEELAGMQQRIARLEKSLKKYENDKSTLKQSEKPFRDITGRKSREKMLEESEEIFRVLSEQSLMGMHIIQDGVFRYANQATADICGFSIEEIRNWGPNEFAKVIHPDDLPLVMEQAKKKQTGEKEFIANYGWRLITKSGDLKWIESYSKTIRFGGGLADFVMMIDITNRKRAEDALRESEERYRMIFNNAPLGIMHFDSSGTIRDFNEKFEQIMGAPREKILGFNMLERLRDQTMLKAVKDALSSQHGYYEGDYLSVTGEKTTPMRAIYQSIKGDNGAFIGAVGIFEDITARRELERSLQEYRDHLEELVRTRTAALARSNADLEQFAYVASHDLQEPLRMVASFTQLLAKRYQGKLDADADEFISFAVDGANRMQRLINDLLAYSRLTTRMSPFGQVDCEKVLDSVITSLALAIDESGASITRDPLPTITGDPSQVGQVFQNLMTNAMKFASKEPSKIHISAELKESDWVFSVRDNGIGIDSDHHERIFVIFQRLKDKEGTSGTGIGLAICKKIVENHGGRIWVESRPGEGSTFFFTIPVGKSNNREQGGKEP